LVQDIRDRKLFSFAHPSLQTVPLGRCCWSYFHASFLASFLLAKEIAKGDREYVEVRIYKQEQDTSTAFNSTDKRQGNMQLFLAIVVALSAYQLAAGIEDEDAIAGEVTSISNLFQTPMLRLRTTKKILLNL
jgi:hypothetical protein